MKQTLVAQPRIAIMSVPLALDTINEYLGPVVCLVARTLLHHGPLSLVELLSKVRESQGSNIATVTSIDYLSYNADIEKLPKLEIVSIKSAVVVLIRYCIVHVQKPKEGKVLLLLFSLPSLYFTHSVDVLL